MPPPVLQEETRALLNRVVRRIVAAVDPERIILFGSQAKGTATEASDIDLLIIADTDAPPRERNRDVRALFPRRSFSLDVFVYTPAEFEQRKTLVNHLCFYAHRDGRTIYERERQPHA